MPWKKGQSGNPLGKKNINAPTVKALFCALGGPHGKRYAEMLHQLAVEPHDDPHVRVKALGIIASYVWGKPKETVELSAPDGKPLVIVHEHKA